MKTFVAACVLTLAAMPAYADDAGGLILPQGFHSSIVADGLAGARHIAVGPNGDLYISTNKVGTQPAVGIYALHLGADHKAAQTEHFSNIGDGTGIRVYHGALYAAGATAVYRIALSKALVPSGTPETIVDGLPAGTHPIAFDGKGGLYVAVAGGNVCVAADAPKVGLKPCPILTGHSGVWRFDASKTDQKFSDGEQIATGIKDMGAMDWSQESGALYGVMHGRDGTHQLFPNLVSDSDDSAIADEMHRITKGTDMGWPYTYYDAARKMRLTAPEYGGDNKTAADPTVYDTPVAAFGSTRQAPLDLLFYTGKQFPRSYRGGAFIAFHGTNGPKIPGGHGGYRIAFMPLDRNGDAGAPVTFADGFAGPTPDDRYSGHAAYRPVGEAQAPDGSLYVVDSNKGRVWRIYYDGK